MINSKNGNTYGKHSLRGKIRYAIFTLMIFVCSNIYSNNIFEVMTDGLYEVAKDSFANFSGKVVNMHNEPMIGATVYFKELQKGVITDNKGHFSAKLRHGIYSLDVSYVGVKTKTFILNTRKENNLVFRIEEGTNLDEVIVTAEKDDRNITSLNMGSHSVSLSSISKMPQMMGEVDVVKAIQLLPGVQPTSDGGAQFMIFYNSLIIRYYKTYTKYLYYI